MQQRPVSRPPRRIVTQQQRRALARRRRRQQMLSIVIVCILLALIAGLVLWIVSRGSGRRHDVPTVIQSTDPSSVGTASNTSADTQSVSGILEITATPEGYTAPETEPPAAELPSVGGEIDPEQQNTEDLTAESEPDAAEGGDAAPAELVLTGDLEEVSDARNPETASEPVSNGPRSVRFRVTGDIMCTDKQLAQALRDGGGSSYNFLPQFELIRGCLQNADYTIGNLETTIGRYKSSPYSGYPQFNTPETLLDAIKDAGYDFLTLANNHMLDRWFDGMKNTVNWVEHYGFDFVGAYRTREERATAKVVDINGIRFGFVAYTQTTNTMENSSDAAAKEYGVPYLTRSDFGADVQRLRAAGAEVVIAFPHWGTEYKRSPDSTQTSYAQKLADAGVDIILASHPHMCQPLSVLSTTVNGRSKSVPIIYCLGNFVTTHDLRYTDWGIILEFTVAEQADGSFQLVNPGYIPTYCAVQGDNLRVIPMPRYVYNRPAGLTDATYNRMCQAFQEAQQMYGSIQLLDS